MQKQKYEQWSQSLKHDKRNQPNFRLKQCSQGRKAPENYYWWLKRGQKCFRRHTYAVQNSFACVKPAYGESYSAKTASWWCSQLPHFTVQSHKPRVWRHSVVGVWRHDSPALYWVYWEYCGWKLWMASVMMSRGFIVSWGKHGGALAALVIVHTLWSGR